MSKQFFLKKEERLDLGGLDHPMIPELLPTTASGYIGPIADNHFPSPLVMSLVGTKKNLKTSDH